MQSGRAVKDSYLVEVLGMFQKREWDVIDRRKPPKIACPPGDR